MASVGVIFGFTYHGQPHQPAVWWFTASCLLVQGRWSHLKTTQALVNVWQTSETSLSKSSLCLPQSLVNVYSYCVMVKSMPCCYVCWKPAFVKSSYILCMKKTHNTTSHKRNSLVHCSDWLRYTPKEEFKRSTLPYTIGVNLFYFFSPIFLSGISYFQPINLNLCSNFTSCSCLPQLHIHIMYS